MATFSNPQGPLAELTRSAKDSRIFRLPTSTHFGGIGFALLEPLEARIAPATLVAGGSEHAYDDGEFTSVTSPTADSNVSAFFGPAATRIHYITLNKGDALTFDHDDNAATPAQDWIQIKGGKAIAFFLDNGDGLIQKNELVGLSLGGSAKVAINGDVNGSILTDLDGATGTFLGNTLADSSKNFLSDLSVTGNITGSVLSGGNIQKLTVGDSVTSVLAGTATGGAGFSLGGGEVLGKGKVLGIEMPTGKVGACISNVEIHGNVELIAAGDGGASASGGNILNVKVHADTGSLIVTAGDGGEGTEASLNGGHGGSISSLDVKASDAHSNGGSTTIKAGLGGLAYTSAYSEKGTGGDGGSLEKITIGTFFDTTSKSWQPYTDEYLSQQIVQIVGGDGGMGKVAGNGGSISKTSVFIKAGTIHMEAGAGGDTYSKISSKVGDGGSLDTIFAISTSSGTESSQVELLAGNGGKHEDILGVGGNGGSIRNVLGVGADLVTIRAGEGTTGFVVGNGGGIQTVFANTHFTRIGEIEIHGGDTWGGQTKSGGNGGSINGVIVGMEYSSLTKSWEPLVQEFLPSSVTVRAGSPFLEGDGGWVTNSTLAALDGEVTVSGGEGGPSPESRCGDGGSIINLTAMSLTSSPDMHSSVYLSAGPGGGGSEGTGGSGGSLKNISVGGTTVEMHAGNGGHNSIGGKAGTISDVNADSALIRMTSLSLTSGNGGDGDLKTGANGGSITGIHASNERFIALMTESNDPSQFQGYSLFIKTGAGGDGATGGGNGGSLSKNYFHIEAVSQANATTAQIGWDIQAGEGGMGSSKGGAGGGVLDSIFEGNVETFALAAGRGGESDGACGPGGDLNKIQASVISDQEATFSSGAGGEGTGANSHGGRGGSIAGSFFAFGTGGLGIHAGAGTAGGSVEALKILSQFGGSINIRAGAATEGDMASNGGAVRNVEIQYRAENSHDISITAGDGKLGGKGGNIEGLLTKVLGTPGESLLPAHYNLMLQAGHGGDANQSGGNGGSIRKVAFVAPAYNYDFSLTAGRGGSADENAGDGGSVEGVTLLSQLIAYGNSSSNGKKLGQPFYTAFAEGITLGSVDINTGNGGTAYLSPFGGNGGNARNIEWNIHGLARMLALGSGGPGQLKNGADGKAISVNPNPNVT